MTNINSNEATTVDLQIIQRLTEESGWVIGDSLLYRPRYQLTEEQKREIGKTFIEPDIVLQDPINREVLAVFENKLDNEKKNFAQLRIDNIILKPRFLYACSEKRVLFYDNTWKGLDAGEFKRVNSFLTYEEMKIKNEQQRKIDLDQRITIDTSIAGGYDSTVGKDRFYQFECIETVIQKYREGKQKMLIHMATGLGKTRTVVALAKALLGHGLAKKILFVVDRRMLAKQALDDGFSLISREYSSARLRTTNFRQQKHASIHVVVIDTLEQIFPQIPNNFYDLVIVDECHRSISISRKLIFDHFLCPRIGLTATPKVAVAKDGKDIPEEDVAIQDTYKLFGCENGEPDFKRDLEWGIDNEFLAPYDVLEIKTWLTKEAEEAGIPIEYVLDPDTREKIKLPKEKKLKLDQLERKYLSEERSLRIAEEIRKNTQWGEKIILFGVSQAHCLILCKVLNQVFNDYSPETEMKYAEAIISYNDEANDFLKAKFKKPYEKPYIAISVDIMSTGIDIPCVRYISFAALTKSVGKYIQMVGRGTRLDPVKSGKLSFRVIDFVGLCKRMDDDGRGTKKQNKKIISGQTYLQHGKETVVEEPQASYFLIDTPDPEKMIQRIFIHGENYKVIDNIPIEKARRIFEEAIINTNRKDATDLKKKVIENPGYLPTDDELNLIDEWFRNPQIYLDEKQLQRMYDYPEGSNWDFILHVLGIKKIPTPQERIQKGYESYLATYNFSDTQLKVLEKMKEIFVSNLASRHDIDISIIFSNPIYERIIGRKEEVEKLFSGTLNLVIKDLKQNLKIGHF